MRLENKVAVVTGGGSGIGEYTVRLFVEEGAKVVISDVNDEKGEALAEELGDAAIYQHADVAEEKDVEALISKTVDHFGKLDILFSNAGIGSLSPADETSAEDWKKVLSINLDGVFYGAKHAVKAMKKSGGGSIINTASILGHVGQAQTSPYSASKGAVVNLTRTLGIEYAPDNIRVNAVCPGYIETPLLDQLEDDMKQHLINLHPIGRLGRSEEVAKAVLFLASDEASFVTGTSLLVDGGYTAQ
ncbi:SDR family NAD(P)-dependent oxidoreductase [Salimicrobium flavidum]|uniref:NAD(P)-dependent dehydrogenase, short-chain alcohol dehydrogenase family n=1 Tax=Salimicrobium flavidum TaxID=570947 RepID=A0A1N7INJ3_9BACI|nr:SDR family NAD(P)-dependent oxidoreductase [Salimicrobium flavidum]SIS38541.1 NAD(P)-dependent dehydrogenase, short-chain alcohol dehydrogenase family [Salimicrobium flavidum]